MKHICCALFGGGNGGGTGGVVGEGLQSGRRRCAGAEIEGGMFGVVERARRLGGYVSVFGECGGGEAGHGVLYAMSVYW